MNTPDPVILHQLFYLSRSVASAEAVEQILASARQHNLRNGITGALMFTGGHFAQLLEGPQPALAQTMARIEGDPRHQAVRLLLDERIAERRCGGWEMALISAPGADDLLHQLLLAPTIAPERARRLLAQLLAAHLQPSVSAP